MGTSHYLASIVAVACYVTALNLRVVLQEGNVTLGAAFAPLLVLVSQRSNVTPAGVVILAAILSAFVVGARHRSLAYAVRDLSALIAASATVWCLEIALASANRHFSGSMRELMAGSVAVLVFTLISDRVSHLRGIGPREDTRVWFVLLGVLISAFGLMILGYAQAGWPVLIAILVVLALTKSEFDRYAMARRTLEQTVSALAALGRASLP